MRIGIPYNDVLDELSAWALKEHNKSHKYANDQLGMTPTNQPQHHCPTEIAEGKPCTVVMDNDDFREDSLTGSETSHYTNVIMAQPTSYRRETNSLEKVVLNIPKSDTRRD